MTKLERHIGLFALTLYGLGDILGAGIYGLVGKAAGELGNAAWMAFVASMIAAGLTGLSYAAVGSRYPKAAGAAYVSYRAFRFPFVSYALGLAVLASGLTSMATACRVFSGYLQGLLPNLPLELGIIGFAMVVTGIVFWGIRESMWANAVCTVVEVSGLVLVLAVGLPYLGSVDYASAATVAHPEQGLGLPLILGGAVLAFYSFVGFEDILNVSEEVKDPARTIPIGLLLAVGISSIVYVGVSLIAVSVVPAGVLAESKQPLVDVVAKAAPWFPSRLFSFISMFAVANTALLNFVMGSRLLYGMAHQGLMPKALGRVHAKRRTPHIATAVVAVILLGLALSGDVGSLAKSTSVLLLVCFCVVNASLIRLKRMPSEPKGGFDVPMIVPALGIMVNIAMLTFAKGPELLRAGIILAVIAALYAVLRPSAERLQESLAEL